MKNLLLLWAGVVSFWMDGAWGQSGTGFQITNVALVSGTNRRVTFPGAVDSYFILERGGNLGSFPVMPTMALGTAGSQSLVDGSALVGRAFYRVRKVLLLTPRDSDGDGMDDVYELNRPTFLNPLNAADAALDFDGDGMSNLVEYFAGTDPAVPDVPGGHLIINEVDYDQAGTDSASFVEILNVGTTPASLTNLALVLVNGNNNTEYARYNLSPAGSFLAAGQFLVVANTNVTVAAGAMKFVPTGVANTDWIQNGPPDGIALINTTTLTVLDALSYEGSIMAAVITGFPGTVNLVEGTPFAGADTNDNIYSLARRPIGMDTNNAVADWTLSTPSPGSANP